MAAAQAHELSGSTFAGPKTADEQTGFVAAFAGFLFGGEAAQGEHQGRAGKTDLLGVDLREAQLAVLDSAVSGLVGAKRGGTPFTACAAAFSIWGQLLLSWIR